MSLKADIGALPCPGALTKNGFTGIDVLYEGIYEAALDEQIEAIARKIFKLATKWAASMEREVEEKRALQALGNYINLD